MTEPVTNQEETELGDESPEAPLVDAPPADADESSAQSADTSPGGLDTSASSGGAGSALSSGDAALQEEFAKLNDRHLRLVAEFNNFKRRSEQERLSAWSRAQADLVENFLDVLDDLHRVADLDLSNATVEAIMGGIDLVERKFVRTISDAGIEMLDPSEQKFDPEVMEAMIRVPAESDDQVDNVAQVFQKGYSLKGILVRPARVSVYTQS